MKRRFFSILMTLLLMGQMVSAVAASDIPMSSAAAYYLEDTMYAFARFPDYSDPTELQVGLMVNGVQVGAEQAPEILATQEQPTEYLLLIDCSTSMPVYQDRILAFADALMAEQYAAVTVATFGEQFRVVAEGLTDVGSLQAVLNGLGYGEQGTDICGGAVYAIDYAKNNLWQTGRLVNLVLITDGVPFYSRNASAEAESELAAAEILKLVLAESPQVLLHSLCFGQWEPNTYDAVASGIGYHLTAENAGSAAEAGNAIAALCGSLYGIGFPLETYSDDLSLKISNREFITVAPVRDLNEPMDDSVLETLPVVIDSETEPETEPETSEAPEPSQEPEPSSEDPEASAAEPETEPETEPEGSEAVSEPETADPEPVSVPEPADVPPAEEQETSLVAVPVVAAVGAGVLLIAVVVIVLLVRKGKKKPGKEEPVGIALRLEVLYGNVESKKRQFLLTDSLFIGSDSRCAVILPDAAPLSARIFLQDGNVYIEDLNSPEGTILGGMRIYAPNPLRSGEQIMIGQVSFSFLF